MNGRHRTRRYPTAVVGAFVFGLVAGIAYDAYRDRLDAR